MGEAGRDPPAVNTYPRVAGKRSLAVAKRTTRRAPGPRPRGIPFVFAAFLGTLPPTHEITAGTDRPGSGKLPSATRQAGNSGPAQRTGWPYDRENLPRLSVETRRSLRHAAPI